MGNIVSPTEIFEKKVKRYLKKFPSLNDTLLDLEEKLIANPYLGDRLSGNTYKVRVADKSKGRGKSGGFRVITYLLKQNLDDVEIFLLTIYDKSEYDTITQKEIIKIIAESGINKKS